MKRVAIAICVVMLFTLVSWSQKPATGDGKKEYQGELQHAVQQVNALAEATPEAKFSWKPAEGVRSISEVYMHIALGNFLLLGLTGQKLPSDLYPQEFPAATKERLIAIGTANAKLEKSITQKARVVEILKRSFEAVKAAYAKEDAASFDRPVDFFGTPSTARGIYLRILVHINEHMGQSIAYARSTGVVPPWSQ